jgi:hypothetical protein
MKTPLVFLLIVSLLAVYADAAIEYFIDKDPQHVLYGNLSQNDPALVQLLGQPLAAVACGPVAVTNSYRYLENKYGWVYDNSLTGGNLAQTAATLAGLMGTAPPGGTFWDDLIWYKYSYIENLVPGKTVYKAQYDPAWQWGIWNDPGGQILQPAWVMPGLPTWQFLWQELSHCEDVEILLNWSDGGHFLTVSSFNWIDMNEDGIIDFNENATFDYIDPCTGQKGVSNFWQNGFDGILETNYNDWAPTITMAVSESIPEPATLLLLGFGGVSLLIRKR